MIEQFFGSLWSTARDIHSCGLELHTRNKPARDSRASPREDRARAATAGDAAIGQLAAQAVRLRSKTRSQPSTPEVRMQCSPDLTPQDTAAKASPDTAAKASPEPGAPLPVLRPPRGKGLPPLGQRPAVPELGDGWQIKGKDKLRIQSEKDSGTSEDTSTDVSATPAPGPAPRPRRKTDGTDKERERKPPKQTSGALQSALQAAVDKRRKDMESAE